jgi:DNA-binding transcriptional LysR family regulator
VQVTILEEDDPAEHLTMLNRGQVHLSVNVINLVTVDDRFASYQLPSFHVLAASAPALGIAQGGTVDIRQLAEHPLLLPNPSFATRTIFDAACRLAGVQPNVVVQSRAAHALLALARAGHGVAIIPSILRPDAGALAVMRVTHQQQPLQIMLATLWDKRRPLPRHGESFAPLLAAHIREVFADQPLPPSRRVPTRSKRT